VNRTRWLAGAAAALAVVLGAGAAFAANGSSNPTADFLGDVAKRLGISEDKLEGAIEDATIARIDAAVAAGEITEEEGDELKERVRSGDVPAILPGFGGPRFDPPVPPEGFGLGRLALPNPLDTAADYLEMDHADVRRALHDGKSLVDLAKDQGKSIDGLKEALRDAIRRDADEAVDDGVLTQEQADDFVEKLTGAVDELVERSGGLGFGLRGPGFGIGPLGPPHKGILPGGLPGGDLMETAADYLGMDWVDIHKALRDGRSLADLANDKGKSVDGLKEALRDAIRKDADKAVDDRVLTQEQADRLADKLGGAVDKFVEGNLSSGFDFDYEGGGGSFEFQFRIGPEERMPAPEERRRPSFEPPVVPPQPI
jgi:lambda repressor-like predicted transcriptional regulator